MTTDNPNCEICGRPKRRAVPHLSKYCLDCAMAKDKAQRRQSARDSRARKRKKDPKPHLGALATVLLVVLAGFVLFVSQVMVR